MGPAAHGREQAAGAGRSATLVAAACSAVLHGALAAGVFLWPTGPVPYPTGVPIVVELIAASPRNDGETPTSAGEVGAPQADATGEAGAAPAAPSAEADAETVGEDVPFEPAGHVEPSAAPAPAVTPAKGPAVPVVPRPARRPAATASPVAEAPAAFVVGQGSATSTARNDGGDSAADGAVGMAAPTGPRFAAGSDGNPLPRYPAAARRRGLEGRVVLRVFVAIDGRPQSISVRSGSSHPILDQAAVEALHRWRFEPARQAGMAVAAWVDVPITFRLGE